MTRKKVSPEINALSTLIFVVVVIVLIGKNTIENRRYNKNIANGKADY
jgi:spermidine/putrescine transport system permease protein